MYTTYMEPWYRALIFKAQLPVILYDCSYCGYYAYASYEFDCFCFFQDGLQKKIMMPG